MNGTRKESKKAQSSHARRNVPQKVVIQATNQENLNPPSQAENGQFLGPKTGTRLREYEYA